MYQIGSIIRSQKKQRLCQRREGEHEKMRKWTWLLRQNWNLHETKLKSSVSFWSASYLFFLSLPSTISIILVSKLSALCCLSLVCFRFISIPRRCLPTDKWSASAALLPAKWPACSQLWMPGASPVLHPVVTQELWSTHHPWSWPSQDPFSAPALRRA